MNGWINHQLLVKHRYSVEVNANWIKYQMKAAKLARQASTAVRPANEALRTRDAAAEIERLHAADRQFDLSLATLEQEIQSDVSPADREPLLRDCAAIKEEDKKSDTAIEQVFAAVRAGDLVLAGEKLAGLNEAYDGVLRAVDQLRTDIRFQSKTFTDRQLSEATMLSRWEFVMAALALLTVLGFTSYGLRLARQMRRSEGRQYASETRYRTLFESSPDAIMTLAPPSWKFTSTNPATLRMFRAKTEAQFIELTSWQLSPERQPDGQISGDKSLAMIETAMRDGAIYFEWMHKRLDGTTFPATVLLTRLELDGVMQLQATVRDITSRKRADQELTRLVMAVEQAAESVVMTDVEGKIQYVNPAFEQVTGYRRAEAEGKNPRFLNSGQQNAEFYQQMWTTINAGKVWSGNFVNRRKDGSLYEEEAVISPVRDAGGKIVNFVAVKRDITEQRKLQQQFLQSQKMEVVGRLAGGVAHDFNNILTAILGYSELSIRELGADNPARQHNEEIKLAALRAARLTSQLLAFSRKQVLQPKLLNLNVTIAEMEKMLQRLIGEHIQLRTTLADCLGLVKADPGQIEQVILNMVVNARDAMPSGGSLTIQTADITEGQQHNKEHAVEKPGDYVLLAITDSGDGMDDDVKSHIFEPFFTTKPKDKGTGLGLSTCFGIVKQSGGSISVYSEKGFGTTFKIYLPRIGAETSKAVKSEGANELPRGGETLLLVEDEEAVRRIAAFYLRDLGYTVLEAGNGQEAKQIIQQKGRQEIHLLFTDVIMPLIGGKELAEWMRTAYPNLKIVFSSGYTGDIIDHLGLLGPGIGFLQKPYTPGALARKVREILDSKSSEVML